MSGYRMVGKSSTVHEVGLWDVMESTNIWATELCYLLPWLLLSNDFQGNQTLYFQINCQSAPWVPFPSEGELVHSYVKNHADHYYLFPFQPHPYCLSMPCDWYIETIFQQQAQGWLHFRLVTSIMIGIN